MPFDHGDSFSTPATPDRAGFLALLAQCLAEGGHPAGDAATLARRILGDVEMEQLTPTNVPNMIAEVGPYISDMLNLAVDGQVQRVLIAPLAGYAMSMVPWLVAADINVTLADNFKAGTVYEGCSCVTLDEALGSDIPYDAFLLGTIDRMVGEIFRKRLMPQRTVSLGDLAAMATPKTAERSAIDSFTVAIGMARCPIVFLASYLDATLVPTLEALGTAGYDVFTITRISLAADAGHARSIPTSLGFGHHIVTGFSGMLELLSSIDAPIILNYARFFSNRWDMRSSVPAIAYCTAALRFVRGARLLLLYDVVLAAIQGFEAEEVVFNLYRRLLDLADGIIVGSLGAKMLAEILGEDEKVLGFLRYGKEAATQFKLPEEPFRIAVISYFLGENLDPTRMTTSWVEAVLRQNVHLHYYIDSAEARHFRDSLPETTRNFFHLHAPILDQQKLVDEMSKYHAGWFVIDTTCFDEMTAAASDSMAQALYGAFAASTVGTGGLLYAVAGLPMFVNPAYQCMFELCAEGTVLAVTPADIDDIAGLIERTDWADLRRRAFEHRHQLTIGTQIDRLTQWLERQHRRVPG